MKPFCMHPLRAAFAAILMLGLTLVPATPALAENPNLPSEEQIEEYIADGSLDERIEYQQTLDAAPAPAPKPSDNEPLPATGDPTRSLLDMLLDLLPERLLTR